MDAQCISNTTRVSLKAMEKHFFLLRVLDHMSSQDEPIGGNPPTYGDLFRGKTRDGPWGHLGRPPERFCGGTPQVSSMVQVPGKAKAESDECPKIWALRARLKQKYGDTFFSGGHNRLGAPKTRQDCSPPPTPKLQDTLPSNTPTSPHKAHPY